MSTQVYGARGTRSMAQSVALPVPSDEQKLPPHADFFVGIMLAFLLSIPFWAIAWVFLSWVQKSLGT